MFDKLLVTIGKQSLTLLLQLLGLAQDQATQEQQNLQTTIITNTQLALQNLTYGLAAAYDQRVDILARLTILQASVDAIPVTPQLAADPVILPTIPPTGYGGASVLDVWAAELGADGLLASDLLEQAGHLAATNIASRGLVVGNSNYFHLSGADIASIPSRITDTSPPTVSAANILLDDTRATWLDREWTITGGWLLDTAVDLYYYRDNPSGNDCRWYCVVDQEWFVRLKAVSTGTSASLVLPPLWPGLELVTLGTPVAIDTGLTITEPMDGVVITITDEPSRLVFFTFDDVNSYRNLGALSFFSDNGDQEPFQPLGFTSAIYCAKTMNHAAGVKLRTSGGVSGTITPWTITAA